MRILIVEDEPGSRWALSELLRDDGHEVRTAEDAPNARNEAARFHPNAVIADLKLPGESGMELLRDLRRHDQRCRFFLTSVYGPPTSDVDAAIEFLPKPIDSALLRRLLRSTSEE